ncbi:MAG TPA: hypothetical protein VJL28_10000 [Gemmatimonadaceae bacterium]|nr:hypothetical protein [Gemmatimonadaceae bacterium]
MISKNAPSRAARGLACLRGFMLVAGLALAAGCDDPFRVTAQFTNVTQPFTVHALSGSPIAFATALNIAVKSVARVDGTLAFDVAFDLNAQGEIVLLPVNVVAQNPAGTRRVGIVRPGVAFESVTEAPRSGYVVDSTTVVRRGEAAVVQSQEPACALSVTPFLHAKIVVDSVDVPARTMYGRALINQNCGFRSLAPGLPAF